MGCDGLAPVPYNITELVQQFGGPRTARGTFTGPDEHWTILGAAGNGAGGQADGGGPGHISNPVTVRFQLLPFLALPPSSPVHGLVRLSQPQPQQMQAS